MSDVTRRVFLRQVAGLSSFYLAPIIYGAAQVSSNAAPLGVRNMTVPRICVFSKHLQFLDYRSLARTCKELGLDGVDLTVRPKGHVEPENLARDLPEAVDAIRAEGIDVSMITTNLNDGDDPTARPILESAGKHNIGYVRCGGLKYEPGAEPYAQLDRFEKRLKTLATIAEENGVILGYHNHSGMQNVGAALWDLFHIIRQVDSPSFGSNFDVGHACVEGGLGAWEINARLLAKYVKMMAVKDYLWENKELRWVSLGTGQAKLVETLKIMREAGFCGPISLHFEYKTSTNEQLLTEMKQATETMRRFIQEAGYST